jgi:hypothetical protein
LRPLLADPRSFIERSKPLAVVTDARAHGLAEELPSLVRALDRTRIDSDLLFLEAPTRIFNGRFSETPASASDGARGLGARRHRQGARGPGRSARARPTWCFDTTDWSTHDTRAPRLPRSSATAANNPGLALSLISFGFKHGVPPGTTCCSTCAFLPNPYYRSRPTRAQRAGGAGAFVARAASTKYGQAGAAAWPDLLAFPAAALSKREKPQLPVDRHRLHRWAASLGGGRRKRCPRRWALPAGRRGVLHRDIERT